MKRTLLLAFLLAGFVVAATARTRAPKPSEPAAAGGIPTIAEKAKGMTVIDGFVPLRWDAKAGKMFLEIARLDEDFLYVESLPSGLGSNDVGLDRGQLGSQRVVRFVRSGPKILLVEGNLAYRADHGTALEKRAVADSFAQSVLAGFEVAAEEGGRVLVDATSFFLRDAHDVVGALKRASQGSFTLDASRSAFWLENTKGFPRNTEVEVLLTFTGTEPGDFVRSVAPDPTSLSVRTRHSLVALPEPGYVPRAFDPRAGYFSVEWADYSMPLGESILRQFITRHRLERVDPSSPRGPVVRPIVYYLDPATPEPMRSALLDGARWWAKAFDSAGFVDAFRVEMLPDDADPMDVRYNVIQWVHRATRGWSYGGSVTDPRTGEILKGHVTLGSLRVRQDYLIAEGLLAPYEAGKPAPAAMREMALARLRQLAAHEVGHTLGLAHDFAGSVSNRASVMDYPHPLAWLREDGTIDLSDAYATGIGAWDEVAIAWGYSEVPRGADEAKALDRLLAAARERGLVFLTDSDARPLGSAHPQASLWDNGTDAVDELARVMRLRATALARFDEKVVPVGRPLATLEEALVPTYLMHRYQLEATAKSIGGASYTYAMRLDGQRPIEPVPAERQRRALAAVLATVSTDALRALPGPIPPRPEGFPRTRELFANRTGGTFDVLAPREAAAGLAFAALLEPSRAARLVEQHARNPELPGLDEVLDTIVAATWKAPHPGSMEGEIRRSVDFVALTHLLRLASDADTLPQVRALTTARLVSLRDWLLTASAPQRAGGSEQSAHFAYGARLVTQWLDDPSKFTLPRVPAVPPGAPIGCDWE